MSERKGRTVRWMVMAAGLAAAGGACAGDDLKNIGIGAGIGILGQIVQGKPITLESAVGSAVGAGIGSQIGDGSGAAVASVVGGLVGDKALQHAKGVFGAGGQAQQAPSGGAGNAGSLAQVAGLGSSAGSHTSVPVHTGVVLEQGSTGPQACEGTGSARQCFPVSVRQGSALILSDGQGIYSCVGGGGALECTRVQ